MNTDAGGDLSSGQGRVTPVKASNGNRRRPLAVLLGVSTLLTAGILAFLIPYADNSADDSWIGPFVVVTLVLSVALWGLASAIDRSRARRGADEVREGGAHPQDGDR